jgi:hypothetical protein
MVGFEERGLLEGILCWRLLTVNILVWKCVSVFELTNYD